MRWNPFSNTQLLEDVQQLSVTNGKAKYWITKRSVAKSKLVGENSSADVIDFCKLFFLFCSYVMSNGYKPAPLDLSDVKLTAGQEVLVDKLAENAHNVWAKDRIKQGWTYGIQQVRAPSVCGQSTVGRV